MSKIAVIDYGMGNLHSVCKALAKVAPNDDVVLTTDAAGIKQADKILLPGQGAMRGCMENIHRLDIAEALIQAAQEKPFLGICIGPQLMTRHSTENDGVDGLGLFACEVVRFGDDLEDQGAPIKIPQMGWNTVQQTAAHPLWQDIPDNSYFYYVHSYHLTPSDATIGTTDYGLTYPAAIAKNNIAGLQAHPEKSSRVGLQFLKNFVNWQP